MLLAKLVETSEAVAGTRARSEKIAQLSSCLSALARDELRIGVTYLSGELPGGKLGVGYASAFTAQVEPAASPALTLLEVDRRLEELRALSGRGSTGRRAELLRALLARATEPEQRFLRSLLVGELRQGALEGVMADAVAAAFRVGAAKLRRALMLHADLGVVAEAAREHGESGLAAFQLELFRPLGPMLADSAPDVGAALAALAAPQLEYKLDGARVQVHKLGEEVRVYTRNLNEVTSRVPELVELVRTFPADALILDGEALSLAADGRPHPFQVSMRRFGAKLDTERLRGEQPLHAFFFDLLHVSGQDLIDRPLNERFQALAELVPEASRVPVLVQPDELAARRFLERALASGHEGIMAKAGAASYEAGRRGASWLKVKPVHTLDLVVLAAEWGSGRRRGFLSNLHLGARGQEPGTFVMLGKTFKGMTDAMLAFQTAELLRLETGRDGHVLHVRPELVVEVAFDGVQASREYPGGVALRFARVRSYRRDKTAAEVESIDTLRALARLS